MAVASERAERFDVKRVLVGRPRATGELDETLLSKKLALPLFASDALSSVAYATESGLVVLVAASAARLVGLDGLPVGEDDDPEQDADRDRDREDEVRRSGRGGDEDDEPGLRRVSNRRQRVGGEDRQREL